MNAVIGHLVGILASGLVLGLIYYLRFERQTPDKVVEAGNRWAWVRQAHVDGPWTEQLNKQLRAQRRIDAVGMFVLCVVIVQVPGSMRAYVACLALVPATLATLRGFSLVQEVTVPRGVRVARLRELSLADYLQPRLRIAMWVAAACGAAATIRVAVSHHQLWVISSAALLLLGPAAVELAGSRLARQPEPAVDAAHLYWQDALRADHIRSTVSMAITSGLFLCLLTPTLAGLYDVADTVVWYGVSGALLLFLFLDQESNKSRPAAYMRSHLWPTLKPDQVLRPGDPLPSPRAAA